MEDQFKGKNSVNLKKVKLKVDFYRLSETVPFIPSQISATVSDTASKHLGALDFHDATPLKSCGEGGRYCRGLHDNNLVLCSYQSFT